MPEPTYRIAQRLLARRAEVGVKQYGQDLTADSPGCMLVHALEEAADQVNYLIAEIQRRKSLMERLDLLIQKMQEEKAPGWAFQLEKLYDSLGGEAALAKYDEILSGAEDAAVAPEPTDAAKVDPRKIVAEAIAELSAEQASTDKRDDTLDTVEMALRNIVSGAQNSFFVKDNAQAALNALSRRRDMAAAPTPSDEALRVATEALGQISGLSGAASFLPPHEPTAWRAIDIARTALAAIRGAR